MFVSIDYTIFAISYDYALIIKTVLVIGYRNRLNQC